MFKSGYFAYCVFATRLFYIEALNLRKALSIYLKAFCDSGDGSGSLDVVGVSLVFLLVLTGLGGTVFVFGIFFGMSRTTFEVLGATNGVSGTSFGILTTFSGFSSFSTIVVSDSRFRIPSPWNNEWHCCHFLHPVLSHLCCYIFWRFKKFINNMKLRSWYAKFRRKCFKKIILKRHKYHHYLGPIESKLT